MTDTPRESDIPALASSAAGDDTVTPDEEIFALTGYAPHRPLRRTFMPWHKPGKQYVRQVQWQREIKWLLGKRPQGDEDSLRYLGLPGPDLLDLRQLYNTFCAGGQRRLTFLGFDESANPRSSSGESLNVSLQEVRSLAYVDERSDVIGDDFRKLSMENSIAWQRTRTLGPFDIINLDLCGHLMSDEPAIDLSIYNALHRIFALQDRRHLPWCLFLTTRIGVDGFSSEVLQALADKIKANVDTCPPFSDALLEHGVQLLSAAELLDPSDGQEFFRTAIVGLVKWLLGLARLVRSRFSVGSVVSYRVQAGALSADMASLVMRFVPVVTIPADPMHIATTSYPVSNECEQAARIPKKVAEMNDLDGLFAENFDLWENFRDSSADLLHQARYDKAAYIAWADEQRGRYQGDSSATSDDAQSVEQK